MEQQWVILETPLDIKKYTPPLYYTIILNEIQLKISVNFNFKIGHGKLNFIYKKLARKRPKQKNLVPYSLFWLDFTLVCAVSTMVMTVNYPQIPKYEKIKHTHSTLSMMPKYSAEILSELKKIHFDIQYIISSW